jgi:hypothetical protein
MMSWSRIFAVAVGVPFLVAGVLYGCSSDRPDANGGGNVGPVDPDRCSVEGQVKECHLLVSVNDGVRSCLTGKQTCRGGGWTACGESGGTITGTNVGLGIPNLISPTKEELLRPKTHLSVGIADAAACVNPCDPACLGYDEDAGALTTDASLDVNAATGLVATPAGFVDKLVRDRSPGNGWGLPCESWNTGNTATGWVHSACQSDYYCSRQAGTTSGYCVQFDEGATQTHTGMVGGTTNGAVSCRDAYPDLTIGVPCGLASQIIVPICNRGAATIPSGTVISLAQEPSTLVAPQAPTNTNVPTAADTTGMAGCPTYGVACNVTLASSLAPGSCVRFNASSCGFNGNKSLYVNPNGSVRECIIQTHVLGPPASAGPPATEQSDQYGCANNYSAFNASQLPTCLTIQDPKTVTFDYNGTCATGQQAQWGKLAWSSSTPSTSSIVFEVRTRARIADGGFGAWSNWATVGTAKQSATPPNDPEVCDMAGPSPCPKDLYAPLADAGGTSAVRGEQLQLRVNLVPVTFFGPVLYAYYLAYSCVDNE